MTTEEGVEPRIYHLAEYKSITFVEPKEYPLFQLKKPLSMFRFNNPDVTENGEGLINGWAPECAKLYIC
ncbi:MAG: hypothetical protein MPEBLZ_04313 [Candidatus Methanoperedens nitroreducens]|uniref:Uncharacterized protein n=1 Tax=Candidatus Methanoperedens nitratireducens TaxID=1392998 RepID=A0A0P8DUQ1_9EURY|nr:MAG: hypothetical protein MPEBLZ_04313 [Candidatus Methanoperedens sp. BLZ1]